MLVFDMRKQQDEDLPRDHNPKELERPVPSSRHNVLRIIAYTNDHSQGLLYKPLYKA